MPSNKKIAGVLTELIVVSKKKYIIVGVGLNVNNEDFPASILDAVSIKQITASSFDKIKLFNSLISMITDSMLAYSKNKYIFKDLYMPTIFGVKEYIPCIYNKKKIYVKILSFTKSGLLSIQIKNTGMKTVSFMDIKFLLN